MYFLYFALAWLPFSRGLLTFEVLGATLTIYIVIMFFLTIYAFYRRLGRVSKDPTYLMDILLIVINVQVALMAFLTGDLNPLYKFVHGLFIPSASYFVIRSLVITEKHFLLALWATLIGISLFNLIYFYEFFASGLQSRVVVLNRNAIGVAASSGFNLLILFYSPLIIGVRRYIAIAPNILGLLATLSRGFIVAMVVSPLAFKLATGRRLFFSFLFFSLISLFVTLVAIDHIQWFKPGNWDPKLENSIERLTNINYWKDAIYTRLGSFYWAFSEFKKSPIFGNGFSTIGATVHNYHMEWLQITGGFGYFTLLSLFSVHFLRASRALIKDPYITAISMFILFMFLNGLMNGIMHGLLPSLLFVAMGLNDARVNIINSKARLSRRRHNQTGDMVKKPFSCLSLFLNAILDQG